MAKWRALHATITTDGKVNRLTEFGQLLYDRIMVKADDWGIITGDTFELKGETIPLSCRTFQEISDALQEMTDQSLIWQYEPEGFGPLVQIRKFDDHQPGALIRKRTAPKLPLHSDWRPIVGDTRSATLLEEVASLIPGIADLLQEITGNGRLDKNRIDKNREDTPKGAKRDTRLDHPAIMGYRELARLHVTVALRDDWIACAEKVGTEHLLGVVKEWIGRGYKPLNVAGMMKVAREGWDDATHQRGDEKREPSEWFKRHGHLLEGGDPAGS